MADQIEVDKKAKIQKYLKTAAEYYFEVVQMAENLKDKGNKKLNFTNSRCKQ